MVAVVKFTFTNRQYIEQYIRQKQYIEQNIRQKQYIEQHTTKQYIEEHSSLIRNSADLPCLYELNPGICLTTEGKARKNLSQGSRNENRIYITDHT